MRFSTTLFHAKNVVLLLLIWGGSLWAYELLPASMPGHFNVLGQVSYRAETTAVRWFLLPGVALGLAGLMYSVALLLPRYPGLMNVPDPKAFAQLAPERKEVVVQLTQDVLYGITALMLLILGVLQLGAYSTAIYETDWLPLYVRVVLWSSLPLLIALGPVVVWLVHHTIQRLHRDQAGS